MYRLLRAARQPVTYSRWLHLCMPILAEALWLFIAPEAPWAPLLLAVPVALMPWMRQAEGKQARFLLTPDEDPAGSGISTAKSTLWVDRWRTLLWVEIRLVFSAIATPLSAWLLMLTTELVVIACGRSAESDAILPVDPPAWAAALLAPLPLVVLLALVVGMGELITAIARRLLGPSAAERVSELEARTEQLLERTRIARELHDSIGHALTVAVVQAGAARAAGDPEFTERALAAIEDTGRAALEDLERVLIVLRESSQRPSQRPTLAEADRLLESARASGAVVDAQLSGALEKLPGPVTREGYRILQEALTNVLRHCGPVPVRVRVEMSEDSLDLEVTNPLPKRSAFMSGSGTGLRGMRERAALLGGETETGPFDGSWRVRARLPLQRIR
ncbi:two-component sensor histidine kinase [Streptomyces sp. BR123]|uniref:sensor histidine kinase n=1 Tax=Streptomyces sp. BR123 TaxID=2749828 RepID=UPI0015C463CB|nr:histidine kinase [Streptomyces sp. BR123]NXY96599.1 two-component sensor histidine kinase [Streptomyces sp. BR123]